LYSNHERGSDRLSLIAVTVISIIVVAGIVGNIYTFQLFSTSVRSLENKVATLQTQIEALTEALGNYNQTSIGNVSLSQLYDTVKDSVVLIRGQRADGAVAGSGFAYYYNYSAQMIIVTNYHVVQGTTSRYVTFMNGHAYSATVLGFDVYADLAALSVDGAPPEEFKPLPIVSSSLLKVGDFVIAVGNPYELIGSMTTGIVSQLGRAVPEDLAGGYSIANVIQTSAPLNPGNSGGPLLNAKGQVVGVTFAIVENSTGVGFAIPSDTILREIAWLVGGDPYPHSWIGANGTDMNYERAQELGTSTTWGWLILNVVPGSPAAEYGLMANDIIIALNDTQIIGGDDISSYLEKHTLPGQTIAVRIERNRSQTTIPLVLGTRPQPPG
jgi:S1-C subfamily serine protease